MSDPQVEGDGPERADRVFDDIAALLDVDISYTGWESDVARKKVFYIRGIEWFRSTFLRGHLGWQDTSKFIAKQKAVLRNRSGWHSGHFDWDAPFSPKQFFDAVHDGSPLQFQKAVETIVLCEVIARSTAQRTAAALIYNNMGIAPALFVINGFDRTLLGRLREGALATLRAHTGQASSDVFYDMADGKAVTYDLASKVRDYLMSEVDGAHIGAIVPYMASRPSRAERILPDVLEAAGAAHSQRFLVYHFDSSAFRPDEIQATEFLETRTTDSGTWIQTREGMPQITAFSCADTATTTIFWPRGAEETSFVEYFRAAARTVPDAQETVRFFYENEIATETTTPDDDADERLIPERLNDKWRSGALSVSLELKLPEAVSAPVPEVIWYTSVARRGPFTHPREAGVQMHRDALRAGLDDLATVVENTHVGLKQGDPPFGSHYARRMLAAITDTIGA